MTNNDYRGEIRAFLETFISEDDFSDDDDIFELGLVSSLMAMQLVLFVEKKLSVRLDKGDLNFDNFRSIAKIDALIQDKLK